MKHTPEDDEPLHPEIQSIDQLLRAIFRGNHAQSEGSSCGSSDLQTPSPLVDLSGSEVDLESLKGSGQTFGPYYIQNVLGVGGYGVVYRATDLEKKLEVALKLPREDREFSIQSFRRFQREPRLLKKLDHPCIVKLIDEGVIENTFFIATQYQDGLDLHQWILKNRDTINETLVIDWGMKLADALQHAFSNGVVHRDLKPRNIIVVKKPIVDSSETESEVEFIPKITDFGLAYSLQEAFSGSTASGAIVGTVGYLPQESVIGKNRRGDIRGDIYAIGIILAELAQGRLLRKPENLVDYIMQYNRNEETINIRVIKNDVSSGLYSILRKCISSSPENRYQTPRELYLDLERLKSGFPIDVKRSNSRENLRRVIRRNPVLSISIVLSFLFLSLISCIQFLNQDRLKKVNTELIFANSQISKQNSTLQIAFDSIRKNQNVLKHTAYNSAIRLGFNEYRDGGIESVHGILDSLLKIDQDINSGLREFSWDYLEALSCNKYRTHMFKDFRLYLSGIRSSQLADLFDSYQSFNERYDFKFGRPTFNQNDIVFRYRKVFARLNNKFQAVFQSDIESKDWCFIDGHRIEPLFNTESCTSTFAHYHAARSIRPSGWVIFRHFDLTNPLDFIISIVCFSRAISIISPNDRFCVDRFHGAFREAA